MSYTFLILLLSSAYLSKLAETNIPSPILSPTQRLYNNLFNNYFKALRPISNQNNSLSVTMQFWFKQIIKLNKVEQIMTVYCWLEMFWMDDFLKWDPKLYNGTTSMDVPASAVWKPDILIYNGANMNIEENELETNVILYYNGTVVLFKAVITDISCKFDMTYFPFDQQICYVMLASWSYDGSKIQLHHRDPQTYLDFYISNSEWELLDFKAKKNMRTYECCPEAYPEMVYFFVIQRNPTYYIVSIIVPSAFITVVTVVGFFTPYSSSGENTEKVSLGVTALLSLGIILLMVADKMPATSKVLPLIGKYYVGLIVILFLAACTTTITLAIELKGNEMKPISRRYKSALLFFAKIFWVTNKSCLDELESEDNLNPTTNPHDNDYYQASYHQRYDNYRNLPANFRRHLNDQNANANETDDQFNWNVIDQKHLFDIAKRIENVLRKINSYSNERKRQDVIFQQWAFVARIYERILMLLFLSFTLAFAFLTLSTRGATITLNDETMNLTLK